MADGYIGALSSLARRLTGAQRRRTAFVLVLTLLNMALQGASVALLIPLLRAAGVPSGSGAVSGIDRGVEAVFRFVGLAPTLGAVLVVFVAMAWGQVALEYLEFVRTADLEQAVVRELRESLYRDLLAARWAFFTERRGSDLTHAVTRDADRAGAAVGYLLHAAAQGVGAAVYALLAIAISPAASTVALVGGVLLALILRPTLRGAHATGEALSEISSDTLALVTQHVEAIKLVKSYGAEQRTFEAFRTVAAQSARSAVNATRTHARAHVATVAGSATLLGIVLFVAIRALHLQPAEILVLAFLFWRLVPRLLDVQQSVRFAIHEIPGYQIVARLLDSAAAARETAVAVRTSPPVAVPPAIVLDRVSFAYEATPVFTDASCTIAAGSIVAFAGPSGAGKTTLVDLILGLIAPTAGVIRVDGEPLSSDRLAGWRAAVAYVPQEALLFHETILANLRWANPDATMADVRESLRAAAAAEFVQRLPAGLETLVGDRGVRLSGGERQRLALARALLRRPAVLVLDEPTSAVDAESEQRILDALTALRGSMTVILVSHRDAPLRRADVNYRVGEGGITAQPSDAV